MITASDILVQAFFKKKKKKIGKMFTATCAVNTSVIEIVSYFLMWSFFSLIRVAFTLSDILGLSIG